jgi:N6-L-threonylcarbamoyladenine synthase
MIILGIETSCDDTCIALVKDGKEVLVNLVSSQINIHKEFGGVVPELASRRHAEVIHIILKKALAEVDFTLDDVDAIAVTFGPGLEGALIVGISVAKTLALLLNKPLIGVNHIHGHIYAHFLLDSPPTFPYLALIASGGHTQMVKMSEHLHFECLGDTRDDAAGEAFDKVARVMGLSYPGGPAIEEEALRGDPKRYPLPIAMKHEGLEFSFSGLKTAVLQKIKAEPDYNRADLCASFQKTVVDTLWLKCERACREHQLSHILLCGGVSANQALQSQVTEKGALVNISVSKLPLKLCTDNAAMIATAAFYYHKLGKETPSPLYVHSRLPL